VEEFLDEQEMYSIINDIDCAVKGMEEDGIDGYAPGLDLQMSGLLFYVGIKQYVPDYPDNGLDEIFNYDGLMSDEEFLKDDYTFKKISKKEIREMQFIRGI
jgi:hypothetical protein